MKLKRYLIVKRNSSTRVTKSPPAIEWDEVYMLLNIELPAGFECKIQLLNPDE